MKYNIFFLLLFALIFLRSPTALAHVLERDDGNTSGVVMHVTPDDNPVVGAETQFYFDIQNKNLSTNSYLYQLSIVSRDGTTAKAATYPLDGQSVASSYIFQSQGSYTLLLKALPIYAAGTESGPIEFTFAQEVSRGFDPQHRPALKNVAFYICVLALIGGFAATTFVVFKRGYPKKPNL